MIRFLLVLGMFAASHALSAAPAPIIDVHRHAGWQGTSDSADRRAMLREMDETGIILALLHINEPADVRDWLASAPGRFLGGPAMPCPRNHAAPRYLCFAATGGMPDLTWLERELAAGRITLLGEMLFAYAGIAPDDTQIAPYWALAARYDVPVAVHINRGPTPGVGLRSSPNCCPDFDERLGNPALLRPILERHPGLRIILQHAGAGPRPYREETLALLRDYATVFVDMSVPNGLGSASAHEMELRALIGAGLGDRIMFGSDNMPVRPLLRRLERIAWLTPAQRRAILYDNAARFLRLDPTTIARHHGR